MRRVRRVRSRRRERCGVISHRNRMFSTRVKRFFLLRGSARSFRHMLVRNQRDGRGEARQRQSKGSRGERASAGWAGSVVADLLFGSTLLTSELGAVFSECWIASLCCSFGGMAAKRGKERKKKCAKKIDLADCADQNRIKKSDSETNSFTLLHSFVRSNVLR